MYKWLINFKMAPAGAGGDDGSGTGQGTGGADAGESKGQSVLFDNNGGGAGGGGGDGGGTKQGDEKANGGNSGGNGDDGRQANSQNNIPENWKESLPQELRALPSLEKLKTVADVVKSYANLETMLGRDKAVIPQKGASPEEFRAYLEKAGLPKELKDYAVEKPKDAQVDEPFFKAFVEQAFKAGVMPDQANALVNWFAKFSDDAYKAQVTEANAQVEAGLSKLKTEWGDQYKQNVDQAKAALKEYATPEEQQYFRSVGLGNNPAFIRLMAKAGASLSEAQIRGDGADVGSKVLAPAQAQLKIKEITNNPKHPYYDSKHADHEAAKKEVEQLYKWAYPTPVQQKQADF